MTAAAPLLEVKNFGISVNTDEGVARILDHVALSLPRAEILGVVGESGCGKSTLARAVLGIFPKAARIESGEIRFEGENLLALSDREMTRRVRGRRIGFIPQDPYLALNPVFSIGAQLTAALRWHAPPRLKTEQQRRAQLVNLLRRVQLPEPEAVLERYPHQFSGGQRQRLMIAAALASEPRLLIADEPTTALDVTTQLQILKLLQELTQEFGIAMLFVTHDFGVVAQLCHRTTVMYAGQTVETGPTAELLADPRHPYTQALIACHPDRSQTLTGIPGLVPSPLRPPPGCRFTPRCPHALPLCSRRAARLVADAPNHWVSCRLADERQGIGEAPGAPGVSV
jgi:oligopeptide/dipeptide ABC transporter ATP-binding protein